MDQQAVILQVSEHIKHLFEHDASGHDWWHMYRVWQLAKTIAKAEPEADRFVVELGALTHDIADWKFTDGDFEAGPQAVHQLLTKFGVDEHVISHVADITRTVSFKGAGVKSQMKTIEGKIVSDADKLDAIGAIGIARVFSYGGSVGRLMYDPETKATLHNTFEEYKNAKGTSINHFYEKLLLLKDRLYTDAAKKLAQHRHEFMERYLEEFYAEWDGRS